MPHNLFDSLQTFELGNGQTARFYSLPQLERHGLGQISRLPVSIPHRARIGAAQLRRDAY